MDCELGNKTFLVTGASGGIGSATTRLLAEQQAGVVLHYHTNRRQVEALNHELPSNSMIAQADLRDEYQVDALFAASTAKFERLDGIVVNAGIWKEQPVPLQDMSANQWNETLSSDLTSAFLTCRGFLRHLATVPRETASVVLVGSTAALFGEAGHADYAAAKAGLVHGLTPSLKNEIIRLAPRGRVNCVCPGWTDTPMAASALDDDSAVGRAMSTMSLCKIATPMDVARAIVFLCSDKLAGHISGAILPVAGGMEGRLLH